MSDKQLTVIKPFGPTIAKATIPSDIIEKLNNYVDNVISNEEKSKKLDHGSQLVGNVKQEIYLEDEIIESSGWSKFLADASGAWIKTSTKKQITTFDLIKSWVVRQFKNEYNPIHWHSGHISGAGYLKLPETFGETYQKNKPSNSNGTLQLIHGSRAFLSNSKLVITPKVGDFYFFPHYLMHAVSPFIGSDEERRSISFNACVDKEIFDVFSV
tara:strand:+ start:674 stop:1312 length:639 start_codon:yes stop_codon:yes gene_type:complete